MTSVGARFRDGIAALREAGVPSPATDARLLMAAALGIGADRVLLMEPEPMPAGAEARFADFLAARRARRPVAQITGRRLFCGREFRVTADTLDPRPETETLVAAALEAPAARILDLGTGTGCILLSVLAGAPLATGLGTDLSGAALEVAASNARALGIGARAAFLRADWWAGVEGRFDLIVSNPPYIAAAEMAGLAPEVRDWEPRLALTDGGGGLSAYAAIARGAGDRLVPGGRLLLEIGPTQARRVMALLDAAGLVGLEVRPDLDGRDRVVCARAPAG